MKKKLRLNLGCGNRKIEGFINIDQSDKHCKPDLVFNLESTPYPFKTSSVEYIRMSSVIEHLPSSPDDFFRILKEFYRISEDGAIIDMWCPDPYHRFQIIDFTHQRPITVEGFKLLNKQHCKKLIKDGDAASPLALMYDIDFVLESYEQLVDDECQKHIENVLGEFDRNKILSYYSLFNNIIQGQRIKLKVRKKIKN